MITILLSGQSFSISSLDSLETIDPDTCSLTSLLPDGMLLTCDSTLDGPLSDLENCLDVPPRARLFELSLTID